MATACRYGLMVRATKGSGGITEPMAMANSYTSMETYTRATGSMIRPTDTECTFT
jgi:hypothetical protein